MNSRLLNCAHLRVNRKILPILACLLLSCGGYYRGLALLPSRLAAVGDVRPEIS